MGIAEEDARLPPSAATERLKIVGICILRCELWSADYLLALFLFPRLSVCPRDPSSSSSPQPRHEEVSSTRRNVDRTVTSFALPGEIAVRRLPITRRRSSRFPGRSRRARHVSTSFCRALSARRQPHGAHLECCCHRLYLLILDGKVGNERTVSDRWRRCWRYRRPSPELGGIASTPHRQRIRRRISLSPPAPPSAGRSLIRIESRI